MRRGYYGDPDEEVCGWCAHHRWSEWDGDYKCVCAASLYFQEVTDYGDYCGEFTLRGSQDTAIQDFSENERSKTIMAKVYKAKLITDTKMRTGKVRLSYPHLFKKYDKSGKYQCVLLIQKTDKDTLNVMRKAIDAAKEQGKSDKWGGKIPGNYASPLHDGDDSDLEGYAGCYYISAKNGQRKPQIVDLDKNDIYDEEEVYPGCYVRASLRFFPYNQSGNGVGCILDNLQKLEDGESLGGGTSSAADDFDDDGEDEDDLLG